jgi:phosphoglycerol transferase MdoB-like AlkP superfamily enzyme
MTYIFLILYLSINIFQLTSYLISGEFLTKLALDNAAFISLMINKQNIFIVISVLVMVLILPLISSNFIVKKVPLKRLLVKKTFLIVIISMLLLSIIIKEISRRQDLVNINYLKHTAPIQTFIGLFTSQTKLPVHFTKQEIVNLNKLGLNINLSTPYSLLKKNFFKKNIFSKSKDFPNIILIFTEGLSARTIGLYNEKFSDLTPNLNKFMENNKTMVVDNYFNHTAATYRGLHGQLCSLYPKYGGGENWDKNNVPSYKCLPDILQHNGYDNVYLNVHTKDDSHNEEMASHLGFNSIISARELSNQYLPKNNKLRGVFTTDHQSYTALEKYLYNREQSNTPLFLTMYTVETHAWVDVDNIDGKMYGDGRNNSLNTIHNMDDAFGGFWNYFKHSPYSKNTIVIFTSDHAHYYEKSYIEMLKRYNEDDYKKVFVDKIPLIIYDPIHNLPNQLDAQSSTSIDLAPTILQILNIPNELNAFIGHSLFERNSSTIENRFGISSYANNTYLIKENEIIDENNISKIDLKTYNLIKHYLQYTQLLESDNKLVPIYEK